MPNEILKAGIDLQRLLFINMNSPNFVVISLILAIPGVSFILINVFILFSSSIKEIDGVVNFFDSTLTTAQVLNMLRVFVKYRKFIRNAINNFNNSPPFEKLPLEKEKPLQETAKYGRLFAKCHRLVSYTIFLCYTLRPIIFREREFSDFYIKSAIIMQSPYYEFVYVYNALNLLIIFTFIVAGDMIIFAFVVKLILDIDALKCCLRRIDFEQIKTKDDETECLKYISQCVDYHNKLNCFAKDIGKLYVPICMVQISCAVLTICAALYNFNNRSLSSNNVEYISLTICAYAYELLIYLFIGTVIKDQLCSIGDAAYECNWTGKTLPKIRKALVIIIHQAQQEICFVVFGKVRIELPSFISLVQLSFSINTLLQTLKGKSQK